MTQCTGIIVLFDCLVCCFGSGFFGVFLVFFLVYPGRKCLDFFAVNCLHTIWYINLFLLTDFPCKLTFRAFIDKQISPVMLPLPCFQSPGYLFAKLHV